MRLLRSVLVPAILGLGLLLAASPALAVDPADYLSEMPTTDKVTSSFAGSDDFDTAALRFAAFSRLEDLTKRMIGERGPAGKAKQAEADLVASYNGSWTAIRDKLKASLPEDQRGFYLGTRYTAWAKLVDDYQADATFNRDFRNLFPAAFQKTYAEMLAERERADAVPLVLPFETAPLTGPAYILDLVADHAILWAVLAVYLVLFLILGPSRGKVAAEPKGARS